MSSKLQPPSVLAFERKLSPSDAQMFAGNWEGDTWHPIALQEKAIRGTISNRLASKIAKDPLKLDAKVEKPNPQTIDYAALPTDLDTLKVRFTLRVLGGVSIPSVCNDVDYRKVLQEKVDAYAQEEGFNTLARRYALNLANARFLWRNRLGAQAISVSIINQADGKCWTFDSYQFSLRKAQVNDPQVEALAEVIAKTLAGGENDWALLEVEAKVRLGKGQEVFPSQEMVLDKSSSKKSRILYQVNGVAGIHSQKIGNALRTIDDWHPMVEDLGVIAIEPYGSVTTAGVACRRPTEKKDFYNLFDNWVTKDKELTTDELHYVVAVLIRGGVFGEAKE